MTRFSFGENRGGRNLNPLEQIRPGYQTASLPMFSNPPNWPKVGKRSIMYQ